MLQRACLCLLLLAPAPALAGNGIMPIGFGTESLTMGGADLAVTHDTSALNINPAGLTRIHGARADMHSAVALAQTVGHRDSYGNDKEVDNDVLFAGDTGYARKVGGRPVWWGIGLFFQNGAGVEYKSLTTAFGNQDELTSLFGTFRLNLGGAVRIGERWSVGISAGPSYSQINQEIFPNTSDAGTSFFGYSLRDMWGLGFGGRVGATFRPNARHAFGITYATPVSTTMKHGTLVSNQTAIGLSRVTYRDVEAGGLNQPQEIGLGYAVAWTERVLLALDLSWIDWSGAVRRSTLILADPDNASAASRVELVADQNWRDQYVMAVGLAFQALSALRLTAGYNHARNPVPDENLNPTLAAIVTDHVTGGLIWDPNPDWEIQSGFVLNLRKEVTYTNPALPFGPGATERQGHLEIHMTVSRNW